MLVSVLAADYWLKPGSGKASVTVYPEHPVQTIHVSANGAPAIQLSAGAEGWELTAPFEAPALNNAIDILLASNRYAERSYHSDAIPAIADDQIEATLALDDATFEFGPIEPVSGLRYVKAAGRVFLQPDRVVPLIRAGMQALLDQRIATDLCAADDFACTAPTSLHAARLVPHRSTEPPAERIRLATANGQYITFSLYNTGHHVELHRAGRSYRYVVAPHTARELALLQPES